MATQWFSNMVMDEPSFFHQWQAESLDQYTEQQIAVAFSNQSHSSESHTSYQSYNHEVTAVGAACTERPRKAAKTNSWNSCMTDQNSPDATTTSTTILSFGQPEAALISKVHGQASSANGGAFLGAVRPKEETDMALPTALGGGAKRRYDAIAGDAGSKAGLSVQAAAARPLTHNQEHILAERKRREKLSQRFIALSKIVPGLKKMDKATVLEDALKYVKQLQNQVKELEGQAKKRPVEAAVLVKKSQLSLEDDDGSSCDENFDGSIEPGKFLPEIEARISERNVLIKIHCEKGKGVLVKALAEIEKLNLTIMNTNVLPFTTSSLDITVMANAEEEFSMSVKDIVKKLNSAFKNFM